MRRTAALATGTGGFVAGLRNTRSASWAVGASRQWEAANNWQSLTVKNPGAIFQQRTTGNRNEKENKAPNNGRSLAIVAAHRQIRPRRNCAFPQHVSTNNLLINFIF